MSEIIGEGETGRFFETAVAVRCDVPDDGWCIELDRRVVKTPLGKPFFVPTSALASGIAAEWNAQGEKIAPATMPLTSLANASIDKIAPDANRFVEQLVGYARSDLLCYWADGPDDLVARQKNTWQPVLDWVCEDLGAEFIVTTGIIPVEQPQDALNVISELLCGTTAFRLTGLVDLAGRMTSVLLALAVWKGRVNAGEAFDAAYLDEVFQEEQWGKDRDAVQRRSVIRNEILSTARFLELLDQK